MATGHRKSTEPPGRSGSNPKIRNIHSMGVCLAFILIPNICPDENSNGVTKTRNPYDLIEWKDLCKSPSLTKPPDLLIKPLCPVPWQKWVSIVVLGCCKDTDHETKG